TLGLSLAGGAIDQRDISAGQVDHLEQSAHRADSHSASDQKHAWSASPAGGQYTVRALGEDQRANGNVEDSPRTLAAHLHGDPQPVARRCSGEGERVRGAPRRSSQEPPAKELAGLGSQLIKVLA